MDSAHHQWPQDEEIKAVEKKPRPEKAQALECPRCKSTNTKFCYYNNYNLSQPRYLCKTCRRYWTQGGSLRNVPVGGGSRKHNKRSSSSSSSKKIFNPVPNFSPQVLPNEPHQNLNLGFNIPSLVSNVPTSSSCDFLAFDQTKNFGNSQNPNSGYNHHHEQPSSSFSLMELLRSGNFGNPQNPNNMCLPGLPVHADNINQINKPNLSFSLHGTSDQSGYGNMLQGFQDHHHESSSRILLPFEELIKQPHVNASSEQAENKEKGQGEFVNGYWNGMVDGGSSW